jgi:hypothetical protein
MVFIIGLCILYACCMVAYPPKMSSRTPRGYEYPSLKTTDIYHYIIIRKLFDSECCPLLGYSAVYSVHEPTFRRNISPPSSGWKIGLAGNGRAAGG